MVEALSLLLLMVYLHPLSSLWGTSFKQARMQERIEYSCTYAVKDVILATPYWAISILQAPYGEPELGKQVC